MARAHKATAEKTADKQRDIQQNIDQKDKIKQELESKPMQAGARPYPVPPFPAQHQKKPGMEFKLDPQPLYDAPFYRGSEKLKDTVALITGGDSGIGRAVAILYAREGAHVAICHLDEERDAEETRELVEKEGRRCIILQGDVSNRAFCEKAVQTTVDTFGKLDVLVNNAAFQVHSSFEDLTEEHFDETLKTNLYGYFFMAQSAVKHMQPGSAIINTGSVTGM